MDPAQNNNQTVPPLNLDTSVGDGNAPIPAAPADTTQSPLPTSNLIQPPADLTAGNQPTVPETPPPPADGQTVATFKPIRGKFGPKGIIATIFGILVLVAATIVGVTQVGQIQIFREKAAGGTPLCSTLAQGGCTAGLGNCQIANATVCTNNNGTSGVACCPGGAPPPDQPAPVPGGGTLPLCSSLPGGCTVGTTNCQNTETLTSCQNASGSLVYACCPSGGTPTQPTATPGGSGTACLPPKSLCSGVCVDTRSDPRNCSTCGHVCQGLTTCINSACVIPITPPPANACPAGQDGTVGLNGACSASPTAPCNQKCGNQLTCQNLNNTGFKCHSGGSCAGLWYRFSCPFPGPGNDGNGCSMNKTQVSTSNDFIPNFCGSQQIDCGSPNSEVSYSQSNLNCGGTNPGASNPPSSCSGTCYSGSLCQFYPAGQCPEGSDRPMENCGSAGMSNAPGTCNGGFCCTGGGGGGDTDKAKCGGANVQVNGQYTKRNGKVANGWHNATSTEIAAIQAGDTIRLTVSGSLKVTTDYENFTKGRFSINGAVPTETTKYFNVPACFPNCSSPSQQVLIGKYFYLDYVVPTGVTDFSIKGEIYWQGGDNAPKGWR